MERRARYNEFVRRLNLNFPDVHGEDLQDERNIVGGAVNDGGQHVQSGAPPFGLTACIQQAQSALPETGIIAINNGGGAMQGGALRSGNGVNP